MPDLDRVSSLVQETMDQFDSPDMTVAALLRRCQRIASLRGDGVALAWLGLEATDVSNMSQGSSEAQRTSLAARLLKTMPEAEATGKFVAEYHGYVNRRRLQPESGESALRSVQQIEGTVQMLRDQEAAPVPPPPGMHTYDLGKYVADQQKERTAYVKTRFPLESILARVKDRVWEFLTETEHELTFGEATAETFYRLRSYVDRQLTTISPPALEQFQIAYPASQRRRCRRPCPRAHLVPTCAQDDGRRTAPGQVRTSYGLGWRKARAHRRCLRQPTRAVRQRTVGKHENGAVVQATLKDVDARLSALNALASKGVHADVTTYEVDTCVVQTYLVVADLLRIRERASDS